MYCTALYCTVLYLTGYHRQQSFRRLLVAPTSMRRVRIHCTLLYCTALHCTVRYLTGYHRRSSQLCTSLCLTCHQACHRGIIVLPWSFDRKTIG
eukprot:6668892-Pyramimonas_sp.AAC.1